MHVRSRSDGLEGGPRETSAAGRCGRQGARQSSARGALTVHHGGDALRAPLDQTTVKPKIRKVIGVKKKKRRGRKQKDGCRRSDNNTVGRSTMGLSTPGRCGASETSAGG